MPVDEVTITILVDNVFDVLMSGTGPVERWPLPADVFRRELPVAEHGFAALAAQRTLAEAMPDAFVPNGVGTTVRLRAGTA